MLQFIYSRNLKAELDLWDIWPHNLKSHHQRPSKFKSKQSNFLFKFLNSSTIRSNPKIKWNHKIKPKIQNHSQFPPDSPPNLENHSFHYSYFNHLISHLSFALLAKIFYFFSYSFKSFFFKIYFFVLLLEQLRRILYSLLEVH